MIGGILMDNKKLYMHIIKEELNLLKKSFYNIKVIIIINSYKICNV